MADDTQEDSNEERAPRPPRRRRPPRPTRENTRYTILGLREGARRPDGDTGRTVAWIAVEAGGMVHQVPLRRSGVVRLPPSLYRFPGRSFLIEALHEYARRMLGEDMPDPFGTHQRAKAKEPAERRC